MSSDNGFRDRFSGAGSSVIRQLIDKKQPNKVIDDATTRICELAKERDVKLLADAEQHAIQDGIDEWTLNFQRRYNRNGEAIVYGTYQAYLRSTPAKLAQHLAIAEKEGFVLGVKLVRGAYMGGDPRQLFWATKEGTDKAYDGITSALLKKSWNDVLKPLERTVGVAPSFPNVNLVLASHNHESVRKALAVRNEQAQGGEGQIKLAFAQLMGMADEVSCDLVVAGKGSKEVEKPQAFKYLVWGTVTECLKYLLRRAEENRDAVVRAKEGRLALKQELRRRILGF